MELDAGYDAHGDEQGQHGGTSVAEEGERQTDDGHHAQTHSHVGQDLEQEHSRHAHADLPVEVALGADADIDDPQNDGGQQQDAQEAAEESQLFPDHGKDEVRVLGGNGVGLGLGAVIEPLPGQSAARDGVDGAGGLIPDVDAQRVDGFVKDDHNAVS